MTTQELYDQIGGNYTEALSRMSMDALVARFVVRFLDQRTVAVYKENTFLHCIVFFSC